MASTVLARVKGELLLDLGQWRMPNEPRRRNVVLARTDTAPPRQKILAANNDETLVSVIAADVADATSSARKIEIVKERSVGESHRSDSSAGHVVTVGARNLEGILLRRELSVLVIDELVALRF